MTERTVRVSLTATVPDSSAADVLEEMAAHLGELVRERGATYASLDATTEDETETP